MRDVARARAREREWRLSDSERVKDYNRQHYDQNRENLLAYAKEYRSANPGPIKAYREKYKIEEAGKKRAAYKRYYAEKKHTFVARAKKRKALKLCATSSWADEVAIRTGYMVAVALREAGLNVHVDHIVPLKSERVCGLHSHDNLAIISAADNLAKGNRYWPDMWEAPYVG